LRVRATYGKDNIVPEPLLRKATERDRAAVMRYLRAEPEASLFIVGDILARGISSDIHELFIQGAARKIEGVLLRWRTSLIPYAQELSADFAPLAEQASRFLAGEGHWTLSGKQALIGAVEKRLRRKPDEAKDHFLCRCLRLKPEISLEALPRVRNATVADAAEIAALLERIEEFTGPQLSAAEMRSEIEGATRRVTLIREPAGGRVVAAASVVAETPEAAMIVGVATDPAFRGRGYASACTARLVQELNGRGKSACLFYNNPVAGRIYRRLGFSEIGRWRILIFGRV